MYPERHHPIFFLQDALQQEGVLAEFNHRDQRTLGSWGLLIEGKPLVWYIDNRWTHERETEDPAAQTLLEQGAIICHAQKRDAERVGGYWLPLAVTPGYEPGVLPKTHDVGSVGYIRDSGRGDMLSLVASHYRAQFAQGAFGEAALRVYWSSRAGLNVPTRYGDALAYDSFNMRSPEILATGIPLVAAYQDDLIELGLLNHVNYVAYHSAEDVCDAIQYALEHPEIGEKGAELALSHHTYTHRAKSVLGLL